MAGYTVDVDALHDLQQQMQHFLNRATEHLARVEGLIGQVSADWDGWLLRHISSATGSGSMLCGK